MWTDSLTPDVPDDGKAFYFYGRDSMSNYFIIGMKQMGIDIFDVENGEVTLRPEKEQIRRLWDNYYVPYVNSWFANLGKFRSDDAKTGDILAYTGSSSSSMYFPDHVVLDDSSRPSATPYCPRRSWTVWPPLMPSAPCLGRTALPFPLWLSAPTSLTRISSVPLPAA